MGARIKKARKLAGLTQAQFSEKLGIPVGTLADWEQGRHKPPEWAVKLITEYLKLNTQDDDNLR